MTRHILIVGTGSAGKRHAKNLHALGCEISCMDPRQDRLDEIGAEEINLKTVFTSLEDAFAAEDRFVPEEVVAALPEAMTKAGVNHRVEIYPGTDHGFAFPNRPAYVKAAAERHWERLFSLFDRNLR